MSLEPYWHKRTLILGDVNSGKTRMTRDLLTRILQERHEEVAVIDLAPEKTRGVGGKLGVPPNPLVAYYTTAIVPPRLTGRNRAEVEAYAAQNAEAIEELFRRYVENPKGILVINDVSLYLQSGEFERLREVLHPSHTVILNGYYGKTLGRGPLSDREREQMERLSKICDRVIRL